MPTWHRLQVRVQNKTKVLKRPPITRGDVHEHPSNQQARCASGTVRRSRVDTRLLSSHEVVLASANTKAEPGTQFLSPEILHQTCKDYDPDYPSVRGVCTDSKHLSGPKRQPRSTVATHCFFCVGDLTYFSLLPSALSLVCLISTSSGM